MSKVSYLFIGAKRIAKAEGSSVSYYYTDHLGSTRIVDNGGECSYNQYTPFGIEFGEVSDERYKFTVIEDNGATGLYYYNARYYDPGVGRFVSEDPAKDGTNWYVYCANNPLGYVDPNGLFKSPWLLRVLVPGQVQWDRAVTAYEEGRYFNASIHALTMVAEQISFVLAVKQIVSMAKSGCDLAIDVVENVTEPTSKTIPTDPSDFNPKGLLKQEYNNGEIIKWYKVKPDGTKGKALFEWNADPIYVNHFHITPDGKTRFIHPETGDTHLWPGDTIPKKFLDFFK